MMLALRSAQEGDVVSESWGGEGERPQWDDLTYLRQDFDVLEGLVRELNERERIDARFVLDRVQAARETIVPSVEALSGRGEAADLMRKATQAVTAVSVMESDVALLSACTPLPERGTVGPTTTWTVVTEFLHQRIKPVVLSISRRVWKIIARHLGLKEWSVSGEVCGGIPALAMGNVSLALTFGPTASGPTTP